MEKIKSYLPEKNTGPIGRIVRFIFAIVVLISVHFAVGTLLQIMLILLGALGLFEALTGWAILNSLEEHTSRERNMANEMTSEKDGE
jgi:hypothetical protein